MNKLFLVTEPQALPAATARQLATRSFGAGGSFVQSLAQEDGSTHLYVFVGPAPSFWLGAQACGAAEGLDEIHVQNPQILPAKDAQNFALSWLLEAYRFGAYKQVQPACRLIGIEAGARSLALATGIGLTRDLINTPANHMRPSDLAQVACELADAQGAQVSLVEGAALEAGFPLIHAVGAAAGGGALAPRLIELNWGPAEGRPLTLIGKGLTYDSGGLNLKPGAGLRLMKKDMAGAAHALGLALMIMVLNLPIRLRVLIPAAENAIGAGAFRPGDVLASRAGLQVEIDNSDAEGRLVLADALSYAGEGEVHSDLTFTFATLTGAARVALGAEIAPYFSNDVDLNWALLGASDAAVDPLWPLPLYDPYASYLNSDIADLVNAGGGSFAGAITAALFLKRFVGDRTWGHFDLYGWNPEAKPGRPKGAAAQGLLSLLTYLEGWAHD